MAIRECNDEKDIAFLYDTQCNSFGDASLRLVSPFSLSTFLRLLVFDEMEEYIAMSPLVLFDFENN